MNALRFCVLVLFSIGCVPSSDEEAVANVSVETIGTHIERLASNEFLGRMPFTEGETLTVNYLAEAFEALGAAPGNGESYFQEVPLVEITGQPSETLKVTGPEGDSEFQFYEDFVAIAPKAVEQVTLEQSELVFAGYGVVAPENDWNDYDGVDWAGKTAVVLVNDPGFGTGDSTQFKGEAMTYYGRWTYKYEEAARQGAAGVLIIHDTAPAAYGWQVVQSGWTGPQLSLETSQPLVDMQGWITSEVASALIGERVQGDLREAARSRDFQPVPLGKSISLSIQNEIKRDASKNVIAILPGTDLKDEYIIYTAHWDHLGVGRPINGDSIYNGAVDNASGTACLMAIAEAFRQMEPTRRSIAFLAVTAEEQGLLGSAYYAENPIFLPEKTVANINMDAIINPGPMKDLTITGYGHSEMDQYAREAAEKQGRYIIPDPQAEKGFFFRSDHFSFAKIGIPALYAKGSYEHMEKGVEFAQQMNDAYRQNDYHQPSDEYDPETTELSGIRLDAQLFFEVGLRLANEEYFPKWYDTSEFKAARE